jgi:hypothetical protein
VRASIIFSRIAKPITEVTRNGMTTALFNGFTKYIGLIHLILPND